MKKKIIVIIVLISLLLPGLQPAQGVLGVGDIVHDPISNKIRIGEFFKNFAKDIQHHWFRYLAKIALHALGVKMRQMILHAGPDGEPALVTNWRDYARNNQDAGANIGKMILGDAIWGAGGDSSQSLVCTAYRDALGQSVGARRSTIDFSKIAYLYRMDSDQTFRQMSQCTLPTTVIVNGVSQSFDINKFSNGSQYNTDTFLRIMTNPANSLSGAMYLAQQEIAAQRGQQLGRAQIDAQAGGGFTSIFDRQGNIKSPGRFVSDAAGSIVNNQLNCLNNVESAHELSACAVGAITKYLQNWSNSLNGLVDRGNDSEKPPQNPAPNTGECNKLCYDSAQSSKESCKKDVFGNYDTNAVPDPKCMEDLYNECIQTTGSCASQ